MLKNFRGEYTPRPPPPFMRGILATHVAFSHCYPPLIYYLTERSLFKKCPPTGKSLKKALFKYIRREPGNEVGKHQVILAIHIFHIFTALQECYFNNLGNPVYKANFISQENKCAPIRVLITVKCTQES